MIRKWFSFSVLIVLISGIVIGFTFINEKNSDDDPPGLKKKKSKYLSSRNDNFFQIEKSNNTNITFGSAYYTDNFDGDNDTISLKSRGYKVYYRGTGTQGAAPVWFQGNLFQSFNGPSTGYLAANYQVLNVTGNVDSWLVLPKKNVSSTDSIAFYSRSDSASAFPDSIRVMFSAAGDSVPTASWTELGRFKVNTSGTWQRKAFRPGSSGTNARFALRYNVVDGGPDGLNSNYIGIDALTLESIPGANDLSAVSVITPSGNINLPVSTIAPKATFKNTGSSAQTNVPVTFKITGPVNYTSNKTIASLNSNATVQINFDSTFIPLAGNYNVTIYSGLAADANRLNDTVKSVFTAGNPNFGSSASYFFANSTTEASLAPSQPQFCRKDTTGSINLALNTINKLPAVMTGDLDDGYWKILIPSGKKIRFFGVNYDTIRIGTNGIISFKNFSPGGGNWSPPSGGIPGGEVLNAIYPLWFDFDFSDSKATPLSRISYKSAGSLFLITFDRAPLFSGTPGEYVSFQVAIDISPSPSVNSRILFQYSDTAGARTGQPFINLVNANSLNAHLIGLQNSSGTSALTYRFKNSSSLIASGRIFSSTSGSLALQLGPDASQLNSRCQTLTLTNRLQAIQLTRKDTLTVSLRESISPYPVIESKKVVYDSLNGISSVPFTLANNGSGYYLYVSHRNSISAWSASPVSCVSNLMNYNFTTALSQAYGNNMILINGKASFYTGDVAKDKIVDLTDIVNIYNSVSIFTTGNYLQADINYDRIVDLTDLILTYNNAIIFAAEKSPPGALSNEYIPNNE